MITLESGKSKWLIASPAATWKAGTTPLEARNSTVAKAKGCERFLVGALQERRDWLTRPLIGIVQDHVLTLRDPTQMIDKVGDAQ